MSEVHVWDMGLLCRWFYTPGGGEWAGARFARAVRNFARPVGGEPAAHVVLACDTHDCPTWRHRLLPEYKGHRPDRPAEEQAMLDKQHATACSLLADIAVVATAPGWEADDIAGAMAHAADEAGFDVVLYSGDKDMAQAMGPFVRLHDGRQVVTEEAIVERFGVKPSQVVDYLAIVGDSCDGVPGVPGLGPKAAVALLETHGTLDRAITHAEQWQFHPVPLRLVYIKLAKHLDKARLCQRLITLDPEVPIKLPWE